MPQPAQLSLQKTVSRARMELSMDGFEPILIDVRVNLGRGNIGVTQHFLDDAQVGAVTEKMRSETVPEQVRINIFLQS